MAYPAPAPPQLLYGGVQQQLATVATSCHSCQLVFSSCRQLNRHLLRAHVNQDTDSCLDCGLSFRRTKMLHRHVLNRLCVTKKQLVCQYCWAQFPCQSKLLLHVSTVHLRRPKTILCESCGTVFSRRGALQRHLSTFHASSSAQPGRRCPLCTASFRAVDNLQRHLVSRHGNWKRWLCALCQHKYNHSVDLKRHLQKSHGVAGFAALTGRNKKDILGVHVLPTTVGADSAPPPLTDEETDRLEKLRRLLAMVTSEQYDDDVIAYFRRLPLARPGIKQSQPPTDPTGSEAAELLSSSPRARRGDSQSAVGTVARRVSSGEAVRGEVLGAVGEGCSQNLQQSGQAKADAPGVTQQIPEHIIVLMFCQFCGLAFASEENLHQHVVQAHAMTVGRSDQIQAPAGDSPLSRAADGLVSPLSRAAGLVSSENDEYVDGDLEELPDDDTELRYLDKTSQVWRLSREPAKRVLLSPTSDQTSDQRECSPGRLLVGQEMSWVGRQMSSVGELDRDDPMAISEVSEVETSAAAEVSTSLWALRQRPAAARVMSDQEVTMPTMGTDCCTGAANISEQHSQVVTMPTMGTECCTGAANSDQHSQEVTMPTMGTECCTGAANISDQRSGPTAADDSDGAAEPQSASVRADHPITEAVRNLARPLEMSEAVQTLSVQERRPVQPVVEHCTSVGGQHPRITESPVPSETTERQGVQQTGHEHLAERSSVAMVQHLLQEQRPLEAGNTPWAEQETPVEQHSQIGQQQEQPGLLQALDQQETHHTERQHMQIIGQQLVQVGGDPHTELQTLLIVDPNQHVAPQQHLLMTEPHARLEHAQGAVVELVDTSAERQLVLTSGVVCLTGDQLVVLGGMSAAWPSPVELVSLAPAPKVPIAPLERPKNALNKSKKRGGRSAGKSGVVSGEEIRLKHPVSKTYSRCLGEKSKAVNSQSVAGGKQKVSADSVSPSDQSQPCEHGWKSDGRLDGEISNTRQTSLALTSASHSVVASSSACEPTLSSLHVRATPPNPSATSISQSLSHPTSSSPACSSGIGRGPASGPGAVGGATCRSAGDTQPFGDALTQREDENDGLMQWVTPTAGSGNSRATDDCGRLSCVSQISTRDRDVDQKGDHSPDEIIPGERYEMYSSGVITYDRRKRKETGCEPNSRGRSSALSAEKRDKRSVTQPPMCRLSPTELACQKGHDDDSEASSDPKRPKIRTNSTAPSQVRPCSSSSHSSSIVSKIIIKEASATAKPACSSSVVNKASSKCYSSYHQSPDLASRVSSPIDPDSSSYPTNSQSAQQLWVASPPLAPPIATIAPPIYHQSPDLASRVSSPIDPNSSSYPTISQSAQQLWVASPPPTIAPPIAPVTPYVTPPAPSVAPASPSVTPPAPSVTSAALSVASAAPSVAPAASCVRPPAPSVTPAALSVPSAAPSVAPAAPSVAPAAPCVRPPAPSVTPAVLSVAPAAPSVTPAAPSVATAAPSVAPAAPSVVSAAPSAPKRTKRSWTSEPPSWSGGGGKKLPPRVLTKITPQVAPKTLDMLQRALQARTADNQLRDEFPCCRCDKLFASKANLRAHLVGHTGETPFHCSACTETFSYFSNANNHLRRHSSARCACHLCGRTFVMPMDLRRHMRTHNTQTKLQCPECPRTFGRADNLARHRRRWHLADQRPALDCHICKKSFTSSDWLRQHLKIHTEVRDQVCGLCGAQFALRSYLERHMKSHGQRRVYCSICPRRFINIKNLMVHRDTFHGNPVPLTEEELAWAQRTRPDWLPWSGKRGRAGGSSPAAGADVDTRTSAPPAAAASHRQLLLQIRSEHRPVRASTARGRRALATKLEVETGRGRTPAAELQVENGRGRARRRRVASRRRVCQDEGALDDTESEADCGREYSDEDWLPGA